MPTYKPNPFTGQMDALTTASELDHNSLSGLQGGTTNEYYHFGSANYTTIVPLGTVAQGDLIYGSAANVYAKLAKDTNATRYLSNTGTNNNPAWSQVSLNNGVSGTLPVANGGSGFGSVVAGAVLVGNGTSAFLTDSINFTWDDTNDILNAAFTRSKKDAWTQLANAPAAVNGGDSVYTGKDAVYALNVSSGVASLYKYSISSNSWTTLTGPTGTWSNADVGLVYTNDDYIYAAHAGTTAFWRYTISTDTWGTLATAPAAIAAGKGAWAGGDDIYWLRGNLTNTFYKYSISGDSWSTMTATSGTAGSGNRLIYANSDYLYSIMGRTTNGLERYSISGNSWTTLANAPSTLGGGSGGAWTGGDYIYVRKGSSTTVYRYSISRNYWETVTVSPASFGNSATGFVYTTDNVIFSTLGGGSTSFYRYSVGGDYRDILTLSNIGGTLALTAAKLSGTLPVALGGIGVGTLSLNSILIGNGTSAVKTDTSLNWDDTNNSLIVGTASNKRVKMDLSGTESLAEYFNTEANPRWAVGRDAIGSGTAGYVLGIGGATTMAAGGVGIGVPATKILAFFTSNGSNLIERGRFDGSGFLGVGTTPGVNFHVVSTSGASSVSAKIENTATYCRLVMNGSGTSNGNDIIFQQAGTAAWGFIHDKTTIGLYEDDDLSKPRFVVNEGGSVVFGTITATAPLDVTGNTIRVRTARTPASGTATGSAGEICWDTGFVYVCTATDTWKRSALGTF